MKLISLDFDARLTYRSWQMMKNRVLNPNAVDYSYYGGRGISLDPRWNNFDNFIMDMGLRSRKELTLERRDNNEHYNKENCYWATRETQSRNRNYCKLDLVKANEIRMLYRQGLTQVVLAKQFSVSQGMISSIVRKEAWR